MEKCVYLIGERHLIIIDMYKEMYEHFGLDDPAKELQVLYDNDKKQIEEAGAYLKKQNIGALFVEQGHDHIYDPGEIDVIEINFENFILPVVDLIVKNQNNFETADDFFESDICKKGHHKMMDYLMVMIEQNNYNKTGVHVGSGHIPALKSLFEEAGYNTEVVKNIDRSIPLMTVKGFTKELAKEYGVEDANELGDELKRDIEDTLGHFLGRDFAFS